MKSSFFSAFLSFISLLTFSSTISATCFYPDGSIPGDYTYTPCGDAAVEPCCTSYLEGACVAGGLCKNEDSQYYIGACTDKTWESPICPNYCKNESSIGGFAPVSSCGGTEYCCGTFDGSCCSGGTFNINNDVVSSTTILSSTTTSSATSTPTITTPAATSSSTPKSGLSAGDIGAIVGTIVGFLGVLVVVLTVYYKDQFGGWVNALVVVMSCTMCGERHPPGGGHG
ncbi:hypothetical protein N431DRAFT_468206 [Stipitochalara longipes BDJ]|nr:hypothetical protein N431DRAFT_468206 [Stipitochalara longipes BDJ]